MVTDPLDVSFVRANSNRKVRRVLLDGTFCAPNHPFVDFRMAVGKGKPAGTVMRRTGKIAPTRIFAQITHRAENEETVIDTV